MCVLFTLPKIWSSTIIPCCSIIINQNNDMKRIEAARSIHALYNSMETRKVKLSTIYRHIVRVSDDIYKYYGVGYDYTA